MHVASETLARVLIVDDNPDIHEDIRKILSPRGTNETLDELESLMFGESGFFVADNHFKIEGTFQGQDALKMVVDALQQEAAFDLAIVDMRMPPGWDGVQTVEKLWEVDPDLQVVICTAYSDYSWDEITNRLGLQDKLLILKKPFDDCELLQAVRALSVKRQLLCQARYNLDTLQLLVTQRSRQLQSLHQESERLLNAISAGLIAYDAAGRVTRWNDVAERLFGLSAQQSLGKPLLELPISWAEPLAARHFFESNLQLENKRTEVVLNNTAGEALAVELSLHPVALDGLPLGGLLLADDVTDRRRLEQQLNQAQKLESVGQLAAGIAHEINTPMQYVGDNVQFLHSAVSKLEPTLHWMHHQISGESADNSCTVDAMRKSLGNVSLKHILEHVPKAIGDVEQGIENVRRIVQAMKELSHPGTETPTAMDIHLVIESAMVVSRAEWKLVATVETHFDPNPPGLLGHANQLQQVILNLLVNAAHAIEAQRKTDETLQGKIRLSTMTIADRFLLSIQDNGCGIPDKIRTRVYDPFFTTKGVGKGTGQGLSIAYQIICKNHQGRLRFESEVGKGTTFYIELPVTDCPAIV